MKPVGILRFLGSNCDFDVKEGLKDIGIPSEFVWWSDAFDYNKYGGFVIPGGFSHGDYLRAGAIAARTPAMRDLKQAAQKGWPVIGICNGFQILCETGILPGVLTKNESLKFQDEWVELEPFSKCKFSPVMEKKIKLPIAHGMGRFIAEEKVLDEIFEKGQVWLKYSKNPNGSLRDIAGITNLEKNVAGLMPHPERAVHTWMGGEDGRSILSRFLG